MSEQNPSQPDAGTTPQHGQYQSSPQNPYGQSSQAPQGQYAQQPYPQGYPQQGQYPPNQYPQAYGQPGYDPQAYGQYPGYPQPQWDATPASENTKPGMIALIIVAIAAVVLSIVSYLIGGQSGAFIADYGIEAATMFDTNDPAVIAFSQGAAGLSAAAFAAMGVGVVGWVVAIVATVRRTGRRFGIWGIVLGILAPVIAFMAMIAGMMPYMDAIA